MCVEILVAIFYVSPAAGIDQTSTVFFIAPFDYFNFLSFGLA
jgi:hypothetical protein